MKQFLIINWKFPYQQVSPFVEKGTKNLDAFREWLEQMPLAIHPIKNLSQINKKGKEAINEARILPTNADKVLIPLHINLSRFDDEVALQQKAFELLIDTLNQKAAVQFGQDEVLFLHHKGQGFSKLNHNDSPFFKYATFGGGSDLIYSSMALLDAYSLAYNEAIVDDNKKVIAVDELHYDVVWDDYWFQVKSKIREFRELLEISKLPHMNREFRKNLQRLSKSLLHEVGFLKSVPPTYQKVNLEHRDINLNFYECGELEKNFGYLDKKLRNNFFTELDSFQEKASSSLIQAVNDIIENWRVISKV